MVIAVGIDRWESELDRTRDQATALEVCGIARINPTYWPEVPKGTPYESFSYTSALDQAKPEDIHQIVKEILGEEGS